MVFFSLDRNSTSSPSPNSNSEYVSSWIKKLDDSPVPAEIGSFLTPSRQTQCKSATSPKPLQSNPNLCTRSEPLFPHTKQILGKRKGYAMDDQEQPTHQEPLRCSGRPRSPTKKLWTTWHHLSSQISVYSPQHLIFLFEPSHLSNQTNHHENQSKLCTLKAE